MNGSRSLDAPEFLIPKEDDVDISDYAGVIVKLGEEEIGRLLADSKTPNADAARIATRIRQDDPVDFLLRMGQESNPEYDHYLSTVFHRPGPLATQGTAPVEPMMPLPNVNPTRSLDRPQGLTRADKVLAVLKDGQWHAGHELTGPTVGGSEGLRRLREINERLKIDGTGKIEARRIAGRASWEYRLVGR